MSTVQIAKGGLQVRSRGPGGQKPARARRSRGVTMGALVAPSLVLIVLINAYPLVYAAIQATHDSTLISSGPYVGADNFSAALSDPAFWKAARFTLYFTLVGVFGSWAVGLGLTLLLRSGVPGRSVFRVLLLLPWVVPVVVSATSWNWLANTHDSPLPTLARVLGFGDVLFLADPTLAALTVFAFKVWVSFPFMMMTTSAALEAVDQNVYEAARMDGASSFQQFFHITLPLIARPTYISWVLMTIFCVNDFPTIFLLTGGGPVDATNSLVVYAYRLVFQDFRPGYGIAVAFLMTAVLSGVAAVLFRQIRKAAR
ncbi:carbohydrate ABC transporter permease [Streptomyces albicerus]|uniref:carbohydrate ABC transporter permease n=1 Tax=Streptomyces albicerus TaxID=2569859 RepID=UPI001CED459F|nr:sugar ABC transporter permease [Streptomyces albicerus]